MRPDGSNAITGFMTQLTLTGGFANKTLFEQAGVALPGDKATWDDWVDASAKVAEEPADVPLPSPSTAPATASPGPTFPIGANYIGAGRHAGAGRRRRQGVLSPSSSTGTRTG